MLDYFKFWIAKELAELAWALFWLFAFLAVMILANRSHKSDDGSN